MSLYLLNPSLANSFYKKFMAKTATSYDNIMYLPDTKETCLDFQYTLLHLVYNYCDSDADARFPSQPLVVESQKNNYE